MKLSEWLTDLDSHTIYDSVELWKELRAAFGSRFGTKKHPPWPHYTAREISAQIVRRGNGGTVDLLSKRKLVGGFEVAEALAERLVPQSYRPWRRLNGLGFRHRAAIRALEEAGF